MADNFDTLIDAESQAMMTDGRCRVLVNRRRAAPGGQASSTSKRNPEGASPGPATANASPTIASTNNRTQAARRRRPVELVFDSPAVAAPTRTRYNLRSSISREEPQVVEVAALPRRTRKRTSQANSDGKDNGQLENHGSTMTLTESIQEYTGKASGSNALMAYRNPVVDTPRRQTFKSSALPSSTAFSTGRYYTYVRSPAQSYFAAETPALASTSGYSLFALRQPNVHWLTDDNDDYDEEAPHGQQCASSYARQLTRLRSEGIGGRNTRDSTRTMGYGQLVIPIVLTILNLVLLFVIFRSFF